MPLTFLNDIQQSWTPLLVQEKPELLLLKLYGASYGIIDRGHPGIHVSLKRRSTKHVASIGEIMQLNLWASSLDMCGL